MMSDPADPDVTRSVHATFIRAMIELRRHYVKASELTLSQTSILGILVDQGPMNAARLAALEDVAGPTMKARIDRFEDLGLVTRQRCRGAGGPVRVTITARGIRAHRAAANDVLAEMLDELTQLELLRLRDALQPLERLLDRVRENNEPPPPR